MGQARARGRISGYGGGTHPPLARPARAGLRLEPVGGAAPGSMVRRSSPAVSSSQRHITASSAGRRADGEGVKKVSMNGCMASQRYSRNSAAFARRSRVSSVSAPTRRQMSRGHGLAAGVWRRRLRARPALSPATRMPQDVGLAPTSVSACQ